MLKLPRPAADTLVEGGGRSTGGLLGNKDAALYVGWAQGRSRVMGDILNWA